MTKRSLALLLLLLTSFAWAGLGSHDAMYMGGTVSNVKEKAEGKTSLADDSFIFDSKEGKIQIPYSQIDSLEYGQKAGRRVGLGVAVNPFFLFSHKRRHYLTVGWTDADKKQQAAVFELGKSIIRPTLRALEQKSGKKVEYQDAEARKSGTGEEEKDDKKPEKSE